VGKIVILAVCAMGTCTWTSTGTGTGTWARADPAPHADPAPRPLSRGGRVLLGPQLLADDSGVVTAFWIEDPKRLVALRLAGSGDVPTGERIEVDLAEPDAAVTQMAPLVLDARGRLGVALVERDVRRLGVHGTLRRLLVRSFDDAPIIPLAEGVDDDASDVPYRIVAVRGGAGEAPAAVLWRRRGAGGERAVLSRVRPGGSTIADALGEGRIASAATWQRDGRPLVAGTDAGRPFVVGPAGEDAVDVPTPAVLSALLPPSGDGESVWLAAGLDGGAHLFVAAGPGRIGARPSFAAVIEPLMSVTPDLGDSGKVVAPPLLVRSAPGRGVWVVWVARERGSDVLWARRVGETGVAVGASVEVARCPAAGRIIGFDAAVRVAAIACARDGRADVLAAPLAGN
jgi:hypothetical protein